jgi:hypothetical protein
MACVQCNGGRRCNNCNGTGMTGPNFTCSWCNGSGTCYLCAGAGRAS